MRLLYKEILAKDQSTRILKFILEAKDIALKAKPGQFVVLMVKKEGERIPLTIVEALPQEGTIILIAQEVGLTTKLLAQMKVGESLYALVGPLGNPTPIKNYGRVILVGGGVGIAELYPVAKALKKADNHITLILGARTKEVLILEAELKVLASDFYITTDDGSYKRKGVVTDVLKELLEDSSGVYNFIYAVGPVPMMLAVSQITKNYNLPTVVSLNSLMVDGTGMCGCCRLTIGGRTRFVCIDGPDFDAHSVNWQELINRNRMYVEKEKEICKLYEKTTS
ncbi:MAG: sulfide/dihydroorotate dehydrogenase-like FAD/NAD-binding protein [Candidatus Omnitrophica bacterium]|nr:sulfide/dihydroorotate dehydrogenase-like FAD/NAD-binding protein [Candidatus Omnitrophota bacterium]